MAVSARRARRAGRLAGSLLAALLLGAAPTPQTARIYASADGAAVYVVGALGETSFRQFDAALQAAPRAAVVYLASPGGLTLQARLMAAAIRQRGLATYTEHLCASACTQLFVAGTPRVLGPDALLGFHQAEALSGTPSAPPRRLTPTTVYGGTGNDRLRLAYERAGIPPAFIARVLATPPAAMWYPRDADLLQARVITRRARRAEWPGPAEGTPLPTVRAQLDRLPLWASAARRAGPLYARASLTVWRLVNSGTAPDQAAAVGRADLLAGLLARVAQADDRLLDQHLRLYAAEARRDMAGGSALCPGPGLDDAATATHAFGQAEDALVRAVLDAAPAVRPLAPGAARQTVARALGSAAPGADDPCRAALDRVIAADRLPAAQRLPVYRALLVVLGGG